MARVDQVVLQASTGAVQSHDAERAIESVCASLEQDSHISSFGLYWLRHSIGVFEAKHRFGDVLLLPSRLQVKTGPSDQIAGEPFELSYEPELLSASAREAYHSSGTVEQLLDNLALIAYCTPDADRSVIKRNLEVAAQSLTLLFERLRTFSLIKHLQHPLDYAQRRAPFINELLIQAALASDMPFVVLRKLNDAADSMEVVGAIGLDDDADLDLLRFPQIPLHCQPVVSERISVVANDSSNRVLPDLPEPDFTKEVESFVMCPVIKGTTLYGALSFGARYRYNYSPLEVKFLEQVAADLGSSLQTYELVQLNKGAFFESFIESSASTILELLQVSRHGARDKLEDAKNDIKALLRASEKAAIPPSFARECRDRLGSAFENIGRAVQMIDQLSSLQGTGSRQSAPIDLKGLWDEVFTVVGEKLEAQQIRPHLSGNSAWVHGDGELLMHAFLNLVLNTCDAFSARPRKSQKQIYLIIDPPQNERVTMRYSDTAGGIALTELRNLPGGDRQSLDVIFEPGVTSKKTGSGYGMWLVRKIFQRLSGSIDVANGDRGAIFRMILPIEKRNKVGR